MRPAQAAFFGIISQAGRQKHVCLRRLRTAKASDARSSARGTRQRQLKRHHRASDPGARLWAQHAVAKTLA